MLDGPTFIPTPVLVELQKVVTGHGRADLSQRSSAMLNYFEAHGVKSKPFTSQDASFAMQAAIDHGTGNGRGGTLNLLDLMVFGIARRLGMPILCTGRDFAEAGAAVHPASRIDD